MKDNNHTDLRTSNAQFLGKGSQYREEDSENKILSKESQDNNISILSVCRLRVHKGTNCTACLGMNECFLSLIKSRRHQDIE